MPPTEIKSRDELKGLIDEIVSPLVGSKIDERIKAHQAESNKAIGEIVRGAMGDAPPREKRPAEKGLNAAKFVQAVLATHVALRGGTVQSHAASAAKLFGKDDEVTKALAATSSVDGGLLVPEMYANELIEFLRPISAVRKLNPYVIPMDSGNLAIPKISTGVTASYIGENANISKVQQQFGQVRLSAKKLAALTPVSNDLLRRMSIGGTQMIRDDIAASIAQRSDLAFIRDDGTAFTPRGIRWVAPAGNIINANGTVSLANTVTDAGKLWTQLANANVRFLRPGWLMAPRTYNYLFNLLSANGVFVFRDELRDGTFWGYPYAVTPQIPINLNTGVGGESELYLADFADVVIGETTQLLLDVSSEAAYYDGTSVVAAFSQDQTVLRAIIEHDLGVRHAESVAVLTQVVWT